MSSNCVVFLVQTEFHLLTTLGLIQQYYANNALVSIYVVTPNKGNRLADLNISAFPNLNWRIVSYDYSCLKKNVRSFIDEIISIHPSLFYFFNDNRPWCSFLLGKLHHSGCKNILLPDGMSAYVDWNVPIVKRIKEFIKSLKINALCKTLIPIHIPRSHYGSNRFIDELWAENTVALINKSNKPVNTYSLPNSFVHSPRIKALFHFEIAENVPCKDIIFFIDGAFNTRSYYMETVSILKALEKQNPQKTIIIKLHPHSGNEALSYYRQINRILILNDSYPAELFISSLVDSTILSVYSTAMLFYNASCRYYWLYKLYSGSFAQAKVNNPTFYISVPSSIESI